MYNIIRRVCPALLNALVLLTFALTPPGGEAVAFNFQESSDSKQQRPQPEELTFTQFDFPDALLTIATGINNRGDIVGAFVDTENIQHGFLLKDGAFIRIDAPDAAITLSARGINDRGQIVVPFQDDMGLFHGALLYRGAFSSIDAPGARETGPHTINNRGQSVGFFFDIGGAAHGYLLDDGILQQIDFPFAVGTNAYGVNNRGQIVGEFLDKAGIFHGFLLDKGVFSRIDFPEATLTQALAINDRGQIVGDYFDAVGAQRGFFLENGVLSRIDFPGAVLTNPSGINNRGQIVGGFGDAAGAAHGFLATKEQFIGKAIGAVSDEETAAVEIFGTFTSPFDFDLSATTLTITNLLDERAGNGDLLSGLPLVLTAVPGSHRNLALFIDRSRPNIASVAILDAGADKFIFRIKIHDATITPPQQCPQTLLTTSFRLEAMGKTPIIVSTERSWNCFGQSNSFLKTL